MKKRLLVLATLALTAVMCVALTGCDFKASVQYEEKDPVVEKVAPTAEDFEFSAPEDLVYDGDAKEAQFAWQLEGIEEIEVLYSSDNGVNWASDKPEDAGDYLVAINTPETDAYEAVEGLTDADWKFTIKKAVPSFSLSVGESDNYTPSGSDYVIEFTYTYDGDGEVTVSSNDENVATVSVDTASKTVTVTPKKGGVVTITVSAAAGDNYKAISAEHVATIDLFAIVGDTYYSFSTGAVWMDFVSIYPNDFTAEMGVLIKHTPSGKFVSGDLSTVGLDESVENGKTYTLY